VCTAGEKRQYLARLAQPLLDVLALPYGKIAGATIDADARPLARPRPVAIPWGDSGHSAVFGGERPLGLRAPESVGRTGT
jgi:hypothetical protein